MKRKNIADTTTDNESPDLEVVYTTELTPLAPGEDEGVYFEIEEPKASEGSSDGYGDEFWLNQELADPLPTESSRSQLGNICFFYPYFMEME